MHLRSIISLTTVAAVCALAGFAASAQTPQAAAGSAISRPGFNAIDGTARTGVREIDLDGLKKILQRDPKDTRPLLINFWATWCDGCREEFPDLVKIDNDYRGKLNFVSVTLHAVDATWDGALPATYLYDKDGKVVFKYFGAIKPAELRTAIDKQLGTK